MRKQFENMTHEEKEVYATKVVVYGNGNLHGITVREIVELLGKENGSRIDGEYGFLEKSQRAVHFYLYPESQFTLDIDEFYDEIAE